MSDRTLPSRADPPQRRRDDATRAARRRRLIGAFVAVVVVSTVAVGALAYSVVEVRQRADENRKALVFLCAQRDNLQAAYDAGKGLDLDRLADRLGVSRKTLRDSRARDKTTLDTMRVLDCPPPPE